MDIRKMLPVAVCALGMGLLQPVEPAQARVEAETWAQVTTRTVEVAGVGIEEAVRRAARDELGVYRRVQPRKAKISNRKFESKGPVDGQPRLSFTAQGPLRIKVDIVTDFEMNRIECAAPARSQGYQYILDLKDSEDKLLDYVTAFAVDICIVPKGDDQVDLVTTTYLRKGPKYRRGFVSLILHKVVKAQTGELVRVLADRSTVRSQASAGANRAPGDG